MQIVILCDMVLKSCLKFRVTLDIVLVSVDQVDVRHSIVYSSKYERKKRVGKIETP